MPMRRAVRITRQAISPRLAMRILENIRWPLSRLRERVAPGAARRRVRVRGASYPHPPIAARWAPPSPALRERGFSVVPSRSSQRDVIVLLPRVGELLVAQHVERAAEAAARRARLDHVVDKAAAGSNKGISELLAVFLRAGIDLRGVAEIGAEDDLDRALRPHHRDFGRGPGEVDVAAQML